MVTAASSGVAPDFAAFGLGTAAFAAEIGLELLFARLALALLDSAVSYLRQTWSAPAGSRRFENSAD